MNMFAFCLIVASFPIANATNNCIGIGMCAVAGCIGMYQLLKPFDS